MRPRASEPLLWCTGTEKRSVERKKRESKRRGYVFGRPGEGQALAICIPKAPSIPSYGTLM